MSFKTVPQRTQADSLVNKGQGRGSAHALSPDEFSNLVKRRVMSLLGNEVEIDIDRIGTDEGTRRDAEAEIKQYYEKISAGNDLQPVSFLYKGADRSRAVCRISTRTSWGTGFLIGEGYLMTNNHVLAERSEAEGSVAEFFYEEDRETMTVKLRPDQLFITDKELDFTIVGCDMGGIEDVVPVRLLRNPATATRGEAVNIIQHPRGQMKQVALQNNDVTYVYDKVLHYRTDTEPGSSGSAVFNNKWELVALHHAGWMDQNADTATNEGIRISAIVAHLIALSNSRNESTAAARKVLRVVTDTSPYLGFFDVTGLVGDSAGAEVELPQWAGNRRFADIGFWNIEHFNNSVSPARVDKVADVVAALSMDLLGLSEVESGALDKLKQALMTRGQNMDYVYLDADGAQDLAVLYDVETSTVKLRSDINQQYRGVLAQTVTVNGSVKQAFAGGREPLFVHCSVKEEGGDTEFLMVVVHLKAFGDELSRERRRLAANILASIIEDLRGKEGLPVILGGDFNQELDGSVLSDLTDSPDLFTLTADDARGDVISYVGDRYQSLIDHIIVSKDASLGQISNDDAAIIRLDRSVAGYVNDVSDHVPLVMRLTYREQPVVTDLATSSPDRKCDCTPEMPQLVDALYKALVKLGIKTGATATDSGTPADGGTATDGGTTAAPDGATPTDGGTTAAPDGAPAVIINGREYYDAEADRAAVATYYAGIDWRAADLFEQLNKLLTRTHINQLTYTTARHNHLYPWVDLQPDGMLKSIYNGVEMDPAEVIRLDFEAERRRNEAINRFIHAEALYTESERDAIMGTIESDNPFNCEHVVPQSWFGKANPMKSDLHHLFSCEPGCNSSRSNSAYIDFPDYNPDGTEGVRVDCGKSDGGRFEPESGKGVVARATLYFLLRYPRKINGYSSGDLNNLLTWHRKYPVDEYEKHRNKAIYEVQGNRNPLIDMPEAGDDIPFARGLS